MAQFALNGRHHLMHGRIGFDVKKIFNLHGAGPRHTANIVADQIDNHQIFRAVLLASFQASGYLRILRGVGAAPFIGRAVSTPFSTAKKSSGDRLSMRRVPSSMNAPWPAWARPLSRAYSASGSPAKAKCAGKLKFT